LAALAALAGWTLAVAGFGFVAFFFEVFLVAIEVFPRGRILYNNSNHSQQFRRPAPGDPIYSNNFSLVAHISGVVTVESQWAAYKRDDPSADRNELSRIFAE
jgi:hypothetical protein